MRYGGRASTRRDRRSWLRHSYDAGLPQLSHAAHLLQPGRLHPAMAARRSRTTQPQALGNTRRLIPLATPRRAKKEAVMTALNNEHEGDLLSDISNEMVALYKDQLGRGPTRARANWAGENRSEEHTSELQSHVNLVCRL